MPVAHADGRYHIDAEGLEKLAENEQILLKYCDENGELTEEANFNDSVDSLAGVCNEKRNVFGMMPHLKEPLNLFWEMKTVKHCSPLF